MSIGFGIGTALHFVLAFFAAGALLLTFQYFSFRRHLRAYSQKWASTYERRKAIFSEAYKGVFTCWNDQHAAFQKFLSKLQRKSENEFSATENQSRLPMAENLALSFDVAVLTSSFLSDHNTIAGQFQGAAERYLQNEFESTGSLVKDLQERLAPEWHERLFGADMESATIKAWTNSIKGHMGESELKEMLEAEGLNVDLPESGSQPGFDLLVEGEEFQVKTVASYASVREHLTEHPDIPTLFNADAEHIPQHVPTMSMEDLAELIKEGNFDLPAVAIEGFTEEAMEAATKEGLEAALGGVDVGIPLATVAMSSYREINTWREGHTDATTALTNVGVDAGARGVGMTAGAKAGAVIGSFIAPGVGTVVGGAVGGLMGGFLGGRGAKAFRERDANASQEELEHNHVQANLRIAEASEEPQRIYSNIDAAFCCDMKAISKNAQLAASRYENLVKTDAAKTAAALRENLRKAKEALSNATKQRGKFSWVFAPEKYAAVRAKEEFLKTQSDDLALLVLNDTAFPPSVLCLEQHKERIVAANRSLSCALLENQKKAALAAQEQAQSLVTKYQPARLHSLNTAIEALEALLPLLETAIAEAKKASLKARADAFVRFQNKLTDKIQELKLQKEKSSARQCDEATAPFTRAS